MNSFLKISALVAVSALVSFPAFAAAAYTAPAATTTKTVAPAKPVVAAATPAKPVVLTFKLIDANHDGKISYTELKKYFPKLTTADFAKADTDKSGFLNKAELATYVKAQQPAKPPMTMMMAPAKK